MKSRKIGGVFVCFVFLCFVILMVSCLNNSDYYRKQEEASALKVECDKLTAENVALKAELVAKTVSHPEIPPPVKTTKEVSLNTKPENIGVAEKQSGINEVAKPLEIPVSAPAKSKNTVDTVNKETDVKPKATTAALHVKKPATPCEYNALREKLAADIINKRLYLYERDGIIAITVPGDMLFSPGEIRIKKPGKMVLKRVTSCIKKMVDKRFRILGHSDDTPLVGATKQEYRDNNYLSMLRAEAVMDFLVNNGISPANVSAVGYGSTKPLKISTTSNERAFNRRVVIVITGKNR